MKGRIIKYSSGTYKVANEETGQLYDLKPRGVLKKESQGIKIGDFVEFNEDSILEILPRKNSFSRPNIANIDYALLCMSLRRPDIDFNLLDKFIINIIGQNVEPIIIVTKTDLVNDDELKKIQTIFTYYEKYYKVFYSNVFGVIDKDGLFDIIKGKLSVVSGQTGAGKSHLLNTMSSELKLKTQEISDALNRGKHTTTSTDIYKIDDIFIADTPGFSSLELGSIQPTDLKEYFPEFVPYLNKCKYHQCLHINEPSCVVKEKVKDGTILSSRYDSYVKFYNELLKRKPIYSRGKK